MIRLRKRGQPVFLLMIFLTLFISVPFHSAFAALIETETAISTDRINDTRVLLNQLTAREDVRKGLLSYGINPSEVDARIACLSNSEIALVAEQMNELPTGAGMDIFLTIFIAVLSVLFILIVSAAFWGYKIGKEQKAADAQSSPIIAPPRIAPIPSINPAEPWTGKWKVTQGRLTGIWSFKQNGDIVVSTANSDYKLEARVYGAVIRGKWSTKRGTDRDFKATIAEDGLSFNGAADYTALQDYFTAQKIE